MSGPGGITRVTITVPMAPPAALLPNNRRRGSGSHWAVQAEATKPYRQLAMLAAFSQRHTLGGGVIFDRPVIVSVTVIWPWERYKSRRRIPDPDAVPTAAKGALDGIVDSGLIPDDSAKVIHEIRGRSVRGGPDELGQTIVVIEEVAG